MHGQAEGSDGADLRLEKEIATALLNGGALDAGLRDAVHTFVDRHYQAGHSANEIIEALKRLATRMDLPSTDSSETMPDRPTALWVMRHVMMWAVDRYYHIDEHPTPQSRIE